MPCACEGRAPLTAFKNPITLAEAFTTLAIRFTTDYSDLVRAGANFAYHMYIHVYSIIHYAIMLTVVFTERGEKCNNAHF